MGNVKWEIFFDESFYEMWAVRPVGDTSFSSPRLFHMVSKGEADKLKELLEKAHMGIPEKETQF